ncbi:MAG: AAA family ATPase [Candidatus Omnitrophica bacterium]|nr:AAA family ATPase [Candidatus Omnitrophota bacterium]
MTLRLKALIKAALSYINQEVKIDDELIADFDSCLSPADGMKHLWEPVTLDGNDISWARFNYLLDFTDHGTSISGKRKEGINWVIDCSIGKGDEFWEYEAVITPDKSVYLRIPGTDDYIGERPGQTQGDSKRKGEDPYFGEGQGLLGTMTSDVAYSVSKRDYLWEYPRAENILPELNRLFPLDKIKAVLGADIERIKVVFQIFRKDDTAAEFPGKEIFAEMIYPYSGSNQFAIIFTEKAYHLFMEAFKDDLEPLLKAMMFHLYSEFYCRKPRHIAYLMAIQKYPAEMARLAKVFPELRFEIKEDIRTDILEATGFKGDHKAEKTFDLMMSKGLANNKNSLEIKALFGTVRFIKTERRCSTDKAFDCLGKLINAGSVTKDNIDKVNEFFLKVTERMDYSGDWMLDEVMRFINKIERKKLDRSAIGMEFLSFISEHDEHTATSSFRVAGIMAESGIVNKSNMHKVKELINCLSGSFGFGSLDHKALFKALGRAKLLSPDRFGEIHALLIQLFSYKTGTRDWPDGYRSEKTRAIIRLAKKIGDGKLNVQASDLKWLIRTISGMRHSVSVYNVVDIMAVFWETGIAGKKDHGKLSKLFRRMDSLPILDEDRDRGDGNPYKSLIKLAEDTLAGRIHKEQVDLDMLIHLCRDDWSVDSKQEMYRKMLVLGLTEGLGKREIKVVLDKFSDDYWGISPNLDEMLVNKEKYRLDLPEPRLFVRLVKTIPGNISKAMNYISILTGIPGYNFSNCGDLAELLELTKTAVDRFQGQNAFEDAIYYAKKVRDEHLPADAIDHSIVMKLYRRTHKNGDEDTRLRNQFSILGSAAAIGLDIRAGYDELAEFHDMFGSRFEEQSEHALSVYVRSVIDEKLDRSLVDIKFLKVLFGNVSHSYIDSAISEILKTARRIKIGELPGGPLKNGMLLGLGELSSNYHVNVFTTFEPLLEALKKGDIRPGLLSPDLFLSIEADTGANKTYAALLFKTLAETGALKNVSKARIKKYFREAGKSINSWDDWNSLDHIASMASSLYHDDKKGVFELLGKLAKNYSGSMSVLKEPFSTLRNQLMRIEPEKRKDIKDLVMRILQHPDSNPGKALVTIGAFINFSIISTGDASNIQCFLDNIMKMETDRGEAWEILTELAEMGVLHDENIGDHIALYEKLALVEGPAAKGLLHYVRALKNLDIGSLMMDLELLTLIAGAGVRNVSTLYDNLGPVIVAYSETSGNVGCDEFLRTLKEGISDIINKGAGEDAILEFLIALRKDSSHILASAVDAVSRSGSAITTYEGYKYLLPDELRHIALDPSIEERIALINDTNFMNGDNPVYLYLLMRKESPAADELSWEVFSGILRDGKTFNSYYTASVLKFIQKAVFHAEAELEPEQQEEIIKLSIALHKSFLEIAGKSADQGAPVVTFRELVRFNVDFSKFYLKEEGLKNVFEILILTSYNIYGRVVTDAGKKNEFIEKLSETLRSKKYKKLLIEGQRDSITIRGNLSQLIERIIDYGHYSKLDNEPGQNDIPIETSLRAFIKRTEEVHRPELMILDDENTIFFQNMIEKLSSEPDRVIIPVYMNAFTKRQDLFGKYVPKEPMKLEDAARIIELTGNYDLVTAISNVLGIDRVRANEYLLKMNDPDTRIEENVITAIAASIKSGPLWRENLVWEDGILIRIVKAAAKNRKKKFTLLFQNIDACPDEVRVELNPVLWENMIEIPGGSGKMDITPNLNFLFTMHEGSHIQDPAFMDRPLVHKIMNVSDKDIVTYIKNEARLGGAVLERLMMFYRAVKDPANGIDIEAGLNDLIEIAKRISGRAVEYGEKDSDIMDEEIYRYLSLKTPDKGSKEKLWRMISPRRRIFKWKPPVSDMEVKNGSIIFNGVGVKLSEGTMLKWGLSPNGNVNKKSVMKMLLDHSGYTVTDTEIDIFAQLARAMKYGAKAIQLVGPSGEGKTEIAKVFSNIIGYGLNERTVNQDTDLADIRGEVRQDENGKYYLHEPEYIKSIDKEGHVFLVNEVNTGNNGGLYNWYFPEISGATFKPLNEFPPMDGSLDRSRTINRDNLWIFTANPDTTSGREKTPGRVSAHLTNFYMATDPKDIGPICRDLFKKDSLNKYVKKGRILARVHRKFYDLKLSGAYRGDQDVTRRELISVRDKFEAYINDKIEPDTAFRQALYEVYVYGWRSLIDGKLARTTLGPMVRTGELLSMDVSLKACLKDPKKPVIFFNDSATTGFDPGKAIAGMFPDANVKNVVLSYFHRKRQLLGGFVPYDSPDKDDKEMPDELKHRFMRGLGILPKMIEEARFDRNRKKFMVLRNYTRLNSRVAPIMNEFLQTRHIAEMEDIVDERTAYQLRSKLIDRNMFDEVYGEFLEKNNGIERDKEITRETAMRLARWFYSNAPDNLYIVAEGTSSGESDLGPPEINRFNAWNTSIEIDDKWIDGYLDGKISGYLEPFKDVIKDAVKRIFYLYDFEATCGDNEYNRMSVRDIDNFIEVLRAQATLDDKTIKETAYYAMASGLRTKYLEGLKDMVPEIKDPADHIKKIRARRGGYLSTDPEYEHLADTEKLARLYMSFNMAFSASRTVILEGPTGGGKSSAARDIAKRMGLPFYEILMYDDIDPGDFLGRMTKSGKEFILTCDTEKRRLLIPFLKAYTKGGVFLLDEGAMGLQSKEVITFLTTLAELGEIDLNDHHPYAVGKLDILTRHPDFHLVIAQNPGGETMGRTELSYEAMSSAFKIWVDNFITRADSLRMIDHYLGDLSSNVEKKDKAVISGIYESFYKKHPEDGSISPRQLITSVKVIKKLLEEGINFKKAIIQGMIISYMPNMSEDEYVSLKNEIVSMIDKLIGDDDRPGYNDAIRSTFEQWEMTADVKNSDGILSLNGLVLPYSPGGSNVDPKTIKITEDLASFNKVIKHMAWGIALDKPVALLEEDGADSLDIVKKFSLITGYDMHVLWSHDEMRKMHLVSGILPKFGKVLDKYGVKSKDISEDFKQGLGFLLEHIETEEDYLKMKGGVKKKHKILFFNFMDAIPERQRVLLNEILTTKKLSVEDENGEIINYRLPEWVHIVVSCPLEHRFSSAFVNRFIPVRLSPVTDMEELRQIIPKRFPLVRDEELEWIREVALSAYKFNKAGGFNRNYGFAPNDIEKLALRIQIEKQKDIEINSFNRNPLHYMTKAVYLNYIRGIEDTNDRERFENEIFVHPFLETSVFIERKFGAKIDTSGNVNLSADEISRYLNIGIDINKLKVPADELAEHKRNIDILAKRFGKGSQLLRETMNQTDSRGLRAASVYRKLSVEFINNAALADIYRLEITPREGSETVKIIVAISRRPKAAVPEYDANKEFNNLRELYHALPKNTAKPLSYAEEEKNGDVYTIVCTESLENHGSPHIVFSGGDHRVLSIAEIGNDNGKGDHFMNEDYLAFLQDLIGLQMDAFEKASKILDPRTISGDIMYPFLIENQPKGSDYHLNADLAFRTVAYEGAKPLKITSADRLRDGNKKDLITSIFKTHQVINCEGGCRKNEEDMPIPVYDNLYAFYMFLEKKHPGNGMIELLDLLKYYNEDMTCYGKDPELARIFETVMTDPDRILKAGEKRSPLYSVNFMNLSLLKPDVDMIYRDMKKVIEDELSQVKRDTFDIVKVDIGSIPYNKAISPKPGIEILRNDDNYIIRTPAKRYLVPLSEFGERRELSPYLNIWKKDNDMMLEFRLISSIGGVELKRDEINKSNSLPETEVATSEYIYNTDEINMMTSALLRSWEPVIDGAGRLILPRVVLLDGETATAKTTRIRNLARIWGSDLYILNSFHDISVADTTVKLSVEKSKVKLSVREFLARLGTVNGQRVEIKGKKTSSRSILLIDEANACPELFTALMPIFLGEKKFSFNYAGETFNVEIDDEVMVVLTFNPPDTYSGRGFFLEKLLFLSDKLWAPDPMTLPDHIIAGILGEYHRRGVTKKDAVLTAEDQGSPEERIESSYRKVEPVNIGVKDLSHPDIMTLEEMVDDSKKKRTRKRDTNVEFNFDLSRLAADLFAIEASDDDARRNARFTEQVLIPLLLGLGLGGVDAEIIPKVLDGSRKVDEKLPEIISSIVGIYGQPLIEVTELKEALRKLKLLYVEKFNVYLNVNITLKDGSPLIIIYPKPILEKVSFPQKKFESLGMRQVSYMTYSMKKEFLLVEGGKEDHDISKCGGCGGNDITQPSESDMIVDDGDNYVIYGTKILSLEGIAPPVEVMKWFAYTTMGLKAAENHSESLKRDLDDRWHRGWEEREKRQKEYQEWSAVWIHSRLFPAILSDYSVEYLLNFLGYYLLEVKDPEDQSCVVAMQIYNAFLSYFKSHNRLPEDMPKISDKFDGKTIAAVSDMIRKETSSGINKIAAGFYEKFGEYFTDLKVPKRKMVVYKSRHVRENAPILDILDVFRGAGDIAPPMDDVEVEYRYTDDGIGAPEDKKGTQEKEKIRKPSRLIDTKNKDQRTTKSVIGQKGGGVASPKSVMIRDEIQTLLRISPRLTSRFLSIFAGLPDIRKIFSDSGDELDIEKIITGDLEPFFRKRVESKIAKLDCGITIDISGSVGGELAENYMNMVRLYSSLFYYASVRNKDVSFSVSSLGSTFKKFIEFGDSRKKAVIEQKLGKVKQLLSSEGTDIPAAIRGITEKYAKRTSKNKMEIVLTDGDDCSGTPIEKQIEMIKEAEKKGIDIIFVGINTKSVANYPKYLLLDHKPSTEELMDLIMKLAMLKNRKGMLPEGDIGAWFGKSVPIKKEKKRTNEPQYVTAPSISPLIMLLGWWALIIPMMFIAHDIVVYLLNNSHQFTKWLKGHEIIGNTLRSLCSDYILLGKRYYPNEPVMAAPHSAGVNDRIIAGTSDNDRYAPARYLPPAGAEVVHNRVTPLKKDTAKMHAKALVAAGDISSPEMTAKLIVDKLLSRAMTGKIALAFDKDLGGQNSTIILSVFEELARLKKTRKFRRILENVEVVIGEPAELAKNIDDLMTRDFEVFMFARETERERFLKKEEGMRAVYVNESAHPDMAYYPLAEIVAISLAQAFDPKTIERIGKAFEKLNISPENINRVTALVFTLIPEAVELDKQEYIRRYAVLKRYLKAA